MKNDSLEIALTEPIMPIIEGDGLYAKCSRCYKEVYPKQEVCHNCNQAIDWSWLGKYKKIREN